MSSCAFFGHRSFDYEPYRGKIKERIVDLIENRGVTTFYSGGRGSFDGTCARIVGELKTKYPHIKNVLVLSYIPSKDFVLGNHFDESVYLLEKRVPLKFSISHTNRKLVETVDYVVSGVVRVYGGAKKACDYAEHLCKTVFYVVDGTSSNDCDWAVKDWENEMQNEEYSKRYKEEVAKACEKAKPIVEEQMAKRARKHNKNDGE